MDLTSDMSFLATGRSTVYIVANMTSGMRSVIKSIQSRLTGCDVIGVKVRDMRTIPPDGTILPLSDISDSNHKVEESEWVEWLCTLFAPSRNVLLYTPEVVRYTSLKNYVADMIPLCVPGTVVFTRTNESDWSRLFKNLRRGENGKLRTVYLKRSLRSTGRGHLKTRTWVSRDTGRRDKPRAPASAASYIQQTIDSSPSAVVIGQPCIAPFTEYSFPVVDGMLSEKALRLYPREMHDMARDMLRRILTIIEDLDELTLPRLWRMDLVWYDGRLFLNEIESIGAEYNFGPRIDFTSSALDAYVDTIQQFLVAQDGIPKLERLHL